ncbi:aspartyl/asparaginyl beta-hydroxylase domain-containing protein [Pseudomonas sp. RHF3.3-3]|uniref:Aspartyl/asparaginyl beta-hydroxylase-like dioxygenase n=1 Tax=Pseudomonas asplenii TaxID=53407 RepID=A0A0N0E3Q2_9PSED|nr:aspartyl/asparaginyl beta-hydroxylase domain-containing protein [Pseudomonas fuscovaginae]KPA90329.1 aspartyl/asparaginyl beta-hydroxylase-like dioxygenase [Pseudomonas fuscovaginae]
MNMDSTEEGLRARANELIGQMAACADWTAARRLAQLMAELGYFPSALQRPIRYLREVAGPALYRAGDFEVVRHLEAHGHIIVDEVMAAVAGGFESFSDVEEPLVEPGGQWQQLVFFEAGVRSERAACHLPATFAVLNALPTELLGAGVVMLSRIIPGTHIVPHCGETNGRLRLHMGINTPADAMMRVGSETVRWQVGRCIVFDDSYEHEVWNLSDEDRIVLIFDFPHPEAKSSCSSARSPAEGLQERVADLLREAHLKGIYMDEQSTEPRLLPDAFLEGKLRRYMTELGARRVELDGLKRLRISTSV